MKCPKFPYCGCYILGPTGPTGPQGEPTATIIVNSTTTGKPGTEAIVTNSGTKTNVLLDFTIPRGETGPAPSLSIGTVTTGEPGTNASVQLTPIKKIKEDET